MNDESLANVLDELEKEVGPERVSALRREAARRKVSVLTLLSQAVSEYAASHLEAGEAA